ncbi:hypothetical protein P7K49_017146 [Saguinus oedipus]|uniref:Uncharacterized protein n=1 Tax=Saguinus oedipus TaxID=9490 RepID=A0ABQ9V2P9_SAGOE|nr:hypothetical protein P7K49_017146 [Saguinus oedipus]
MDSQFLHHQALGSPFPGRFAPPLGTPTLLLGGYRVVCTQSPGLLATRLERGFPGNALRRGGSQGFPVTRAGGERRACLSPAKPRNSQAKRAWGNRETRTGRAGGTQPFEVRLRGNAPATVTDARSGRLSPHAPLPGLFPERDKQATAGSWLAGSSNAPGTL